MTVSLRLLSSGANAERFISHALSCRRKCKQNNLFSVVNLMIFLRRALPVFIAAGLWQILADAFAKWHQRHLAGLERACLLSEHR